MKKTALLFFCLAAFTIYSEEKLFTKVESDNMSFQWRTTDKNIECIVKGKTTGWVAVGFDPTTKMKDANFIIGYVTGETVIIEDHFGHSPIGHKQDTVYPGGNGKDNITGKSGSEKDGWTEIRFTLPIDSSDKFDTVLGKGKHNIILGYGPKDNTTSKHSYIEKKEIVIE